MKKRLFSIITILGIGCSFCCADTFNIHDYYPNISPSDGNNSSFNNYAPYQFGVLQDSIILESFCYNICLGLSCNIGFLGKIVYSINSGDVLATSASYKSGDLWCFDFPNNLIINPGDYFLYNAWGLDRNSTTSPSNYNLSSRGNNGSFFGISIYRPIDIDGTVGFKYIDNFGINIVDYGGFTAVSPVVIYEKYITNPEFKVNYGNTSYQYELDSDLSIYLKSPVIQSGNTFTYVGSTGLNLFYNGTSQRYTKSNLYLDSMFWFNNNIFTPICL